MIYCRLHRNRRSEACPKAENEVVWSRDTRTERRTKCRTSKLNEHDEQLSLSAGPLVLKQQSAEWTARAFILWLLKMIESRCV